MSDQDDIIEAYEDAAEESSPAGYRVFMAVVDRAGGDPRDNFLFQRAPDDEELIYEDEVIEKVGHRDDVEIGRTTRCGRRIHDELPVVAKKFREFLRNGDVSA